MVIATINGQTVERTLRPCVCPEEARSMTMRNRVERRNAPQGMHWRPQGDGSSPITVQTL